MLVSPMPRQRIDLTVGQPGNQIDQRNPGVVDIVIGPFRGQRGKPLTRQREQSVKVDVIEVGLERDHAEPSASMPISIASSPTVRGATMRRW